MSSSLDPQGDVVFPEYYEDIFNEEDVVFRFRLIRQHIHGNLRVLLSGCLDLVAEVFETDPFTFSKMRREPKKLQGDDQQIHCALYGLYPNDVRGKGFPNLHSSTRRPRTAAEIDLSFVADRSGLGLELHIERRAELNLLEEVYDKYRDQIDALLTCVRLGVDGTGESRLVTLRGMIEQVRQADNPWIAIYEPRYPFPIAWRDFAGRFEECFLALYLIYDAMLSCALGIEDKFEQQFELMEQRYSQAMRGDDSTDFEI
ncbi:MAG: hypothetical protein ACYTHK_05020 [Planctomycetota bacterium]|jgi:hypothetical protein